MANQEEIRQLLDRLDYHRRRLAELLRQMAMVGVTADPKYHIEVEEIRTSIRVIKLSLRTWRVEVEDHPDDIDLEREVGSDHPARRRGVTPPGNRLAASLRDAQVDRITALRELMAQIPEMRDVIVSCHAALRSASKHLHELHGYKSLHDGLHTIQRQCYEQILAASRRLFTDGYVDDQLDTYMSDLEGFIDDLLKIVEKYIFLQEITSWLPRFVDAYTTMRAAITDLDAERFSDALSRISSILKVYPSQIHQKLSEAAHKMDLEVLIADMSDIRDKLTDLHTGDSVTRSFDDDISRLHQLMGLVGDHGRWQALDALLDLIERSKNRNDLVECWYTLKARAELLYATSEESSARFLRERAVLLEQAIGEGDTPSIARHIQTYRARASRQFYDVDKRLNELCKSLDSSDSMLAVMRGVLA
jgi:hypothetical protein